MLFKFYFIVKNYIYKD